MFDFDTNDLFADDAELMSETERIGREYDAAEWLADEAIRD